MRRTRHRRRASLAARAARRRQCRASACASMATYFSLPCEFFSSLSLALCVATSTTNAGIALIRYCVEIDEHCPVLRSEEHTSELQSLMRISYAVFCLKKKKYSNL